MKLYEAIEVLEQMRESAEGERAAALAVALEVLAERSMRVQAAADNYCEMLDQVFPPSDNADRLEAWSRLRPMFRLSPEVLDEVERRIG